MSYNAVTNTCSYVAPIVNFCTPYELKDWVHFLIHTLEMCPIFIKSISIVLEIIEEHGFALSRHPYRQFCRSRIRKWIRSLEPDRLTIPIEIVIAENVCF